MVAFALFRLTRSLLIKIDIVHLVKQRSQVLEDNMNHLALV